MPPRWRVNKKKKKDCCTKLHNKLYNRIIKKRITRLDLYYFRKQISQQNAARPYTTVTKHITLTFMVAETAEGQSPAVGHDFSNLRRCVWHRIAQNVARAHNKAGTERLQTSLSTDCHLNGVFITSTESQLPSTQRCIYEVMKGTFRSCLPSHHTSVHQAYKGMLTKIIFF